MEDTKITHPERFEKLVFILAIAFLWSYSIGIERNENAPIRIKSNGQIEYSLFRYGYDWIRRIVIHFTCLKKDLQQALRLFLVKKNCSFGHT